MIPSPLPVLYLRPHAPREPLDWEIGVTPDVDREPAGVRDHVVDGGRYVVLLDDSALAECSAHHLTVIHTWSDGWGDHDNYAVLRIEAILDDLRWRELPWGHRGPGELFYGWTHGHDEMIRDDPEGMGWVMVSWEEVEQSLAEGVCRLEFQDGTRCS